MVFKLQGPTFVSSAKYNAIGTWNNNTGAGRAWSQGQIVRPTFASVGVTMTAANPCVVTWRDNAGSAVNHNFAAGDEVVFTTTGALPSHVVAGTKYFVISAGLAATTFEIAATVGGSAISTNGDTQSGVHTGTCNYIHGNEKSFVCIVAGTGSTTTEPLWTVAVTRGQKFTDGTATFQETGGSCALNGDLSECPTWTTGAKNTAITIGHVIKSDDGTKIFIASVAGTAGNGAEPTWATTAPWTTVDGGITWNYIGTSFSAWASPLKSLTNATATNWGSVSTNTTHAIYVGNSHNVNYGAALTWTSNGSVTAPLRYVCIDETAGVNPPAAYTTGAIESNCGGNLQTKGWIYVYGITLANGNGNGASSNTVLYVSGDTADKYYDNCTFQQLSSGATASIDFGASTYGRLTLVNPSFKVSAVGHLLRLQSELEILGGSLDGAGTIPTVLFQGLDGTCLRAKGMDLSNITTTIIKPANGLLCQAVFEDCKINASATLCDVSVLASGGPEAVLFTRCDSAATNYKHAFYKMQGTETTDINVGRLGGAIDGTQHYSWKIATAAADINKTAGHFKSLDMGKYCNLSKNGAAANVTATVYGIQNAASLSNNDQIWAEFRYLGTSTSPISTIVHTRPASWVTAGSGLTADSTSDWTAAATSRGNSTVYAVGDIIKVSSNAGRLFFCTAIGSAPHQSSSSLPAGYASAVDGGSVTDGDCTFRAGCRFTLSATFSAPQPQIYGNIYAQIGAGQTSITFYIDPALGLA